MDMEKLAHISYNILRIIWAERQVYTMSTSKHNDQISMIVNFLMDLDIGMIEELSPIRVSHPFIEEGVSFNLKTGEVINLIEDEEALKKEKELRLKRMRNMSPMQIVFCVSKPYRILYLYLAFPYLTKKERSEIMHEVWISVENINNNVNVSQMEILKMLRKCNPKYLMGQENYEVYEKLPDTFTVYRGLQENAQKDGLSWTLSKDVAEWFAGRFENDGEIIEKTVHKAEVIAYFNDRDEEEIVLDIKKVLKREKAEKQQR